MTTCLLWFMSNFILPYKATKILQVFPTNFQEQNFSQVLAPHCTHDVQCLS